MKYFRTLVFLGLLVTPSAFAEDILVSKSDKVTYSVEKGSTGSSSEGSFVLRTAIKQGDNTIVARQACESVKVCGLIKQSFQQDQANLKPEEKLLVRIDSATPISKAVKVSQGTKALGEAVLTNIPAGMVIEISPEGLMTDQGYGACSLRSRGLSKPKLISKDRILVVKDGKWTDFNRGSVIYLEVEHGAIEYIACGSEHSSYASFHSLKDLSDTFGGRLRFYFPPDAIGSRDRKLPLEKSGLGVDSEVTSPAL